jgi:hypothetical protein
LKKLLLFQQFALNNPDFLTAKCKLKDYYTLDDNQDLKMDTDVDVSTRAESTEPDTPSTEPKVKDEKDESPTGVVSPPKSATAAVAGGKKTDNNNKSSQSRGPRVYLGRRVVKDFGSKTHFGTVSGYSSDNDFWRVKYDNGDEEDFETKELESALRHCKKKEAKDSGENKKKLKKRSASVVTTTSPTRKSKRIKLG